MRVNQCVRCEKFPCSDVRHDCYIIPDIELRPEDISIVMISEAAPASPANYYYAGVEALFAQTTVQAFQDARADVSSIKAVNYIARRAGEGRVIPAGSTYKIRGPDYFWRGRRAFPSYLQAGPSFFIEKSKRKMIAEDIAAALRLMRV